MPKLVVYLFMPLSWLYGLIIAFRKWLYSSGVYSRTSFNFPVICVGNISAGGTGKTPHIEWLIEQLQNQYQLAVLSRGYKRKTIGYILSSNQSTPKQIGDEPYQIKQKFPNTTVAVCENRVLGIPSLLGDAPNTQVILMDDGFQHMSIKAGFNIVLCDYNRPYYADYLLPAGLLRESPSGANRADIIIVTKCKPDMSLAEQQHIISQLKLGQHQHVFFTSIVYQPLVPLTQAAYQMGAPESIQPVIALAGIAKPNLFVDEIKQHYKQVKELIYSDHQTYTDDKIQELAAVINKYSNVGVITTEKDAVKLASADILPHLQQFPIWYMPIGVKVLNNQDSELVSILVNYIQTEQSHATAE
jgi:tetraacyldisaccharide 4'-kinase